MRRTLLALALLPLALAGCDTGHDATEDSPSHAPATVPVSPGPTASAPGGGPSATGTGSAAPAPDVPGPERSPGAG